MKKIIIIAISLLLASSLFAEQKVCRLKANSYDKVDTSIKVCKAGDIITWYGSGPLTNTYIVSSYCHQEKQITLIGKELHTGVCTYTGKKLEIR